MQFPWRSTFDRMRTFSARRRTSAIAAKRPWWSHRRGTASGGVLSEVADEGCRLGPVTINDSNLHDTGHSIELTPAAAMAEKQPAVGLPLSVCYESNQDSKRSVRMERLEGFQAEWWRVWRGIRHQSCRRVTLAPGGTARARRPRHQGSAG